MTAERARRAIAELTRSVVDFPAPNVVFKDLTPVLADAAGFAAVVDALSEGFEIDAVAGIDARGFLLGGAIAHRLGVGVIAVRKTGKLPPPVLACTYDMEYGTATLEIPADALDLAGRRVLIVDDVLATGGTIAATARLLAQAGAQVVAAAVVLELDGMNGRGTVTAALTPSLPIRALATG